jgi:hypothetical protein
VSIGIKIAKSYEGVNKMSNIVVITNNDVVLAKYSEKFKVDYLEGASLLETLEHARDMVHQGHVLLTHPLSGSVKPNDTPYKTIIVSSKRRSLDYSGLSVIEEGIESTKKFINGRSTPMWTDKVKSDFKLVDCTIISTAIQSMDGKFIG